jgi:hypothetical protein
VKTQIFEFKFEKEFWAGEIRERALEGILSLNTFPICCSLEEKQGNSRNLVENKKFVHT